MSERWCVVLDREPQRVRRKVDAELRRRFLARLHGLERDPRPHDVKKLKGFQALYRPRVGDWRITYAIKDQELIVLVVETAPRGGAYENL